jgi:1-phosphofructokinase
MRARHPRRPTRRHGTRPRTRVRGRIAVFAPSPILTVTIERGPDRPEVHLHPGGQGFWVARMAANLDAEVVLCCGLGGEPGRVLWGLMETEPLTVRAADALTPNGVYVHDRRSGHRIEIASAESRPLTRHAADELYGIAVAAALDADVTLVTGTQPADIIDADVYRRLVTDLRSNDKLVMADVTGPPLLATVEGGIELLKLSSDEMVDERLAASHELADIVTGARALHAAGARRVLISRGPAPAILVEDGENPTLLELSTPVFEELDHRGAGDSMFAATGVGLARGMTLEQSVRLGTAAGALNVTRRGLGTGTRDEIERLAAHVTVRSIPLGPPCTLRLSGRAGAGGA